MPDHRIRLRAAWIGEFPDGATRVDLPTDRASLASSRPFRLIRSFRIPLVDAGATIALVLDDVPGVASVWLDDERLAEVAIGVESLTIPLGRAIRGRVSLALEVDPGRWIGPAEDASSPWGSISLSIRGGIGTDRG